MRIAWLLVVVMLWGCSLLGVSNQEHPICRKLELVVPPEGHGPYAFICLDGQPWRPDSVLGTLDYILESGERVHYLVLFFTLRDPTPALPFYEAVLSLSLYEKPLQTNTTYYLFNSNPYLRKLVANGTYTKEVLGEMGRFRETEGDVFLAAYWIAREDSLRSWVRFDRIDTVQVEPFLLVFYEGAFEVVLSPFSRDPAWSRYPDAKLHFQGRFRVPAVTWDYLHRCWRERNCLRVGLRTL
ncbi:hypothetical protein [Rhodothermus profundi]|uniref:Uncharacterized protein n=1 Tax=Rhodothermus profundi TaxID=633813 RepID=A0A1M6XBR7_9BACT|nr:hypothetical protein [Rhodothermus profundi]SHL03402.1 hypothetical protein SAMN04488087_2581 [Rhodothermus profundi]